MTSRSVRSTIDAPPLASWFEGWRLDVVFTLLTLWLIAGVTFDFRTHAHGISFEEEGFFTLSHIAFYSAFVAIAAFIGLATYRNRRRGTSWFDAIPPGYGFGVLGVVLFAIGGPGDFLWHSTFGFEVGVEALTSPTHLLLATGATLFMTSPLRAAWARDVPYSPRHQLPVIVSAALVFTVIVFLTLYQSPLSRPMPAPGVEHPSSGVISVLAFAAVVAGLTLTLHRRFRLVPGAFAVIIGGVGVLVAAIFDLFVFVPAMVLTGLVADALHRRLRPTHERAWANRLFGTAVPFVLIALYFLTVAIVWEIAWTIHVWTGAIVLAGASGLLVSYLVLPYAGVVSAGFDAAETGPTE